MCLPKKTYSRKTMNVMLSSNQRNGLLVNFALATIMAVILLHGHNICAMPREPWPPYPESPALDQACFDENYFPGQTNSELVIFDLGFLDESWSGYALQRAGESVTPFIIPALNAAGTTNISSDTGGALRWWVRTERCEQRHAWHPAGNGRSERG